jgi:S1-C subfamily serine protease
MAGTLQVYPINFIRILACCLLLASSQPVLGHGFQNIGDQATKPTLVLVNIISETHGAPDTIEINGKPVTDYSPTIVQTFPSTGIVLDHTHVMAFLGYRWIYIQNRDPRIEISTDEGEKWEGKLIGIDQRNGVAVIQLLSGKLKETPVCPKCEIKDGITVMAPVIEGADLSQYRKAQILSVGAWPGIAEQSGWMMAMNHAFPDIGLPILTTDGRVLGFVASQDPMGNQTLVYPISQLLSSAQRILKTKADIRTGWLGIFPVESRIAKGPGVVIRDVEPDSPAARAGLTAGDLLIKYRGQQIRDTRQFVYLVEGTPIGSKAKLELIRQGNPVTVFASIEARKPQQNQIRLSFSFPGPFGPPAAAMIPELEFRRSRMLIGLDTMLLTPSLAEALQMPGQTGLLVADVVKQKPADRAGVLVGDIITSIDDRPIVDPFSFASYLMTRDWSAPLILRILRKGTERTITIQVPDQGQ